MKKRQDASPVDSLLFFFSNVGQPWVTQPADAGVGMVIHNAVEGSVDAIADIVVKHLVAAGVLAHSGAVDVQHQAGRCLSKVPDPKDKLVRTGTRQVHNAEETSGNAQAQMPMTTSSCYAR